MTHKTKTKPSFQKLLDKTKRTQYTNKEVVDSVEPCDSQELEFFTLGKSVSEEELEAEYASRGLEAAHPYALAFFSLAHEEMFDEKKYVATQWKDAKGKWCYATFYRWDDARNVVVNRSGSEWRGGFWSFAGLRKSSAPNPSELSNPQSLDLSSAIKICKETGYQVVKIL